MKTILLSWKLFLKKPFSNAVLAIELALTLLIVVIVSNAYQYSQSSIRVIENSQSRMLYCSDPNFADPDSNLEKEEKAFEQTLRNLHERFHYVKGFSKIYESAILFERKHFDKGEAMTPEVLSQITEPFYREKNRGIGATAVPDWGLLSASR